MNWRQPKTSKGEKLDNAQRSTLNAPQDFDELADWLVTIGSQFSPAELHGALVGALSGAMRLPARQWALFGLAVTGADQRLDEGQFEEAIGILGGLASTQLEQLTDIEMAFQLFLPDDDHEIEQRTESLAHWCKGFLGGFAEARAHTGKAAKDQSKPELTPSVVEALQDMAAIAQASAQGAVASQDDGDHQPEEAADWDEENDLFDPLAVEAPRESTGDEEAERDYVEVIEYLRLAALTVFTEHGWVEATPVSKTSPKPAPPADNERTIH